MKRFIMIFVVMLFITTSALAIDNTGANAPEVYQGLYPVKFVEGVAKITNASDPEWYNYAEGKWANAVTLDKLGQMNPDEATEDNITGYYVWIPRYAYMIRTGYNSSDTGRIDIKFLKGTTNKDNNGKEYYTVEDLENQSNRWEELSTITYVGDRQMDYLVHPAFKFDQELSGIWVGKYEASQGIEREIELVNTIPNEALWTSIDINGGFEVTRDMTSKSEMYDKYNLYGLEEIVNTHLVKATEYGAVVYLDNSMYGDNIENKIYRVNGIDSIKEYIAGGLEGATKIKTDKYINKYIKDEGGNLVDLKGSAYQETSDGVSAWNNATINNLTDENGVIVKENAYGTVASNGEETDVGFRVVLTKGKSINEVKEVYVYKSNYSGTSNSYCWLMSNGDVWVMGENKYGMLGVGDTNYRCIPEKLEFDSEGNRIPKIDKVFLGGGLNITCLTEEGAVYVAGDNDYGQLGIGTQEKYSTILTKIPIPEDEKIKNIEGSSSRYFFAESGKIYACGSNSSGSLGVGTTDKKVYTVKEVILPAGEIIKEKSGSRFLMESGKVYACGSNSSGSLGVTSTATEVHTLEQVTALGDNLIDSISGSYYVGKNCGLYNMSKATSVAGFESLKVIKVIGKYFLCSDNKLYDNTGTLVSGLGNIEIKDVLYYNSNGEVYFVLGDMGGVYAFGNNSSGRLGVGTSNSTETGALPITALEGKMIEKIVVDGSKTYILTVGGTVYLCGGLYESYSSEIGTSNTLTTASREVGLDGIEVKDIVVKGSGFENFVYYLTKSGEVYVCGNNSYGQLGIEGERTACRKVTKVTALEGVVIEKIISNGSTGDFYTYYISDKGEIYVSGNNKKGELGPGFEELQVNIATKSEFLTSIGVKSFTNNCYVTNDNQIYANVSRETVDVLTIENSILKIKDMVTDGNNTWYITEKGEVYVCGSNYYGQLGIGNLESPTIPTKVKALEGKVIEKVITKNISAWYITDQGEVYACGNNGNGIVVDGLLGIGSKEGLIYVPTRVGEDENLRFRDVKNYGTSTWYITDKGDVYACGDNTTSKLGVGSISKVGWEVYKATKIDELEGKNVIDVIASGNEPYNLYYLLPNGHVYGTGNNGYGEFGLGKTGTKSKPALLTFFSDNDIPIKTVKPYGYQANAVYFITTDNELYVTGYNSDGQLGVGGTDSLTTPKKILENVVDVIGVKNDYANKVSIYCLTGEGEVYVSGANEAGQLGVECDEDTTIVSYLTKISDLENIVVSDVIATAGYKNAENTVYFIGYNTASNQTEVYACGYNNKKSLGVASSDKYVTTPMRVTGFDGVIIKERINNYVISEDNQVYSLNGKRINALSGANIKEKIGNYLINDEKEIYTTTGVKISGLDEETVKKVVASGDMVYAITDKNEVYGYSTAGNAALGIGAIHSVEGFVHVRQSDNSYASLGNTTSIYGNSTSTIFEQDNGGIYVIGDNTNNKLGLVGKIEVAKKINLKNIKDAGVGSDFSVFLKDDGSIVGYGNESKNGNGLNNIEQIAVSNNNAYFMKKGGLVIDNQSNIIANNAYKIVAGAKHLVVLKKDGTTESYGQANSSLSNVIDVFAGKNMTVYVTNDNKTYIMEGDILTELSIKNIVYAELNGEIPYFLNYDRNLIDKDGNPVKLGGTNLTLVKEVKGDVVLNERMKVYDMSKI